MIRLCILAAILLGGVSDVRAQVVSYEANSFPEISNPPWTRHNVGYLADRWLDGGWFVQFTEMVQCGSQSCTKQDWYDYGLAVWNGSPRWYCQWRMVTDGPNSGIPSASPAGLAIGGYSGVLYQVIMASDRVRFLRDALLPLVWADITPGAPHTYRIELYGPSSYVFYIDGNLIDSGVPEGAYPTSDSFMTFGARAPGQAATTRWEYIRFGSIPADHSGDYDSNGVVDSNDLYFFIDCLLAAPDYDNSGPGCRFADMNGDGKVDGADVQLFAQAMTSS